MPQGTVERDRNVYKAAQALSLAIATTRSKAADRLDYKYYTLDLSLKPLLLAVASRMGHCKLQLVDGDGDIVATDRFDPLSKPANPLPTKPTALIDIERDEPLQLRISPVFDFQHTGSEDHRPYLTIPRTITLSHDELKSIKGAKVEITFDE